MSNPAPSSTHRQILKSSALIGGSSAINILVGMIRTKFTAIYLGTEGVGLMGTYSSITGMVATLTGMGIGSSGVRQIAEAVGSGDQERIARTSIALRRASLALGLTGTLLLILVAKPACQWTFGNALHVAPVMLLSLTVLLGAVSGGQIALVQGTRRIGDLARLGILGSILGTIVSIPMMMAWGRQSVVPILLALSGIGILSSWFYARKIVLPRVTMGLAETWRQIRPLLSLGSVFAASALMATAVAYLTRVIIIRRLGLDAVGLYGAAWTLSSFYVSFILNAMSADFFPRLSAAAGSHDEMNRLVNEQTEVAVLLSLPGLLATLTFAPWVIRLFYSAAFVPAGEVLQWQVLGLVLRMLSWPMGFIMLAKGTGRLFFCTELAIYAAQLGLTLAGVDVWGLPGTGIAFFGAYLFYATLVAVVSRRLTGFRWTGTNGKLIALAALVSAGYFLLSHKLPPLEALFLGTILAVTAGLYSLKRLARLTGMNPVVLVWRKIRKEAG